MLPRRTFLGAAAAGLAAGQLRVAPRQIIDTHTHFYDPARPEGVPWPPKDDKILYRTVLPGEFVKLTKPFGVSGTIVVEASPWLEDNQWVLDVAKNHPAIVGVVGHLEPGQPEFPKHLERFVKNPLFRGIRLNRFKVTSIADGVGNPRFVADLKRMAAAGWEADVGSGPASLGDVVRLSDAAPDLRLVINHMPFDHPSGPHADSRFKAGMREVARRPQVFVKVSHVLRRRGETVPLEPAAYKAALDELWDIFGPDRLVYGSNWPVSDLLAPYGNIFGVVYDFFTAKGQEASDKYFWKNSIAAYLWTPRAAG
jgi:predicted TIM-barrel fold metal-dependent hydrolase